MSNDPSPPSYEISQQAFDQKVSDALDAFPNDDQWEEWPQSEFEAAAQAPSSSAGRPPSPTTIVTPEDVPQTVSRLSRRASLKRPKEEPSWLAEAGLSAEGSSTRSQTDSYPDPGSSSMTAGVPSRLEPLHSIPDEKDDEDEEEDRSIPPPPWAAIGPSLDGPPFEEDDTLPAFREMASSPPSPLASPSPSHPSLLYPPLSQLVVPDPPSPRTPPRRPRQSLPPPRRAPPRMGPRPLTFNFTKTSTLTSVPHYPQAPHMRFDPLIAYNTPHAESHDARSFQSQPQPQPQPQSQPSQPSYTSFYNAAVTPHLPQSSVSAPANQPQFWDSRNQQNPQWSGSPDNGRSTPVGETSRNHPAVAQAQNLWQWHPTFITSQPAIPRNNSSTSQFSSYPQNPQHYADSVYRTEM